MRQSVIIKINIKHYLCNEKVKDVYTHSPEPQTVLTLKNVIIENPFFIARLYIHILVMRTFPQHFKLIDMVVMVVR